MFTLHNATKLPDLSGYFVTSHACPMCGTTDTVIVTPEELFAYNQGSMVQQVLSRFDADIRERFISGICGECWNFPDDTDF